MKSVYVSKTTTRLIQLFTELSCQDNYGNPIEVKASFITAKHGSLEKRKWQHKCLEVQDSSEHKLASKSGISTLNLYVWLAECSQHKTVVILNLVGPCTCTDNAATIFP